LSILPLAGCYASARPGLAPASLPLSRFRADSSAFTTYSGIADSTRLVIRDEVRWRDYWRRIHTPFIPPPPVPEIDFAREMIVVAALGSRPSAGYDIVIQSAERDSTGIQVVLRRSNPGRGCMVGAAVTQPVDLARLGASDLPVRFAERITTASCGVP
jgi:hypothetical protein